VLDAFNLVLHGALGIKKRYHKPGFKFDDWLKRTHNTTVTGEDCNVGVQLTLEDPSVGVVMIKRDYWFERAGGSVDMELTVRINGKPLTLEVGESKHNMAQKWIEAFIPVAVSQRFLFDGEKLPELNFSEMNQEFSSGLDDILGQQAIQQLNYHLNSVMKATTKQMTPEEDQNALDDWFAELEKARTSESQLKSEIEALKREFSIMNSRSTELHNMIMSKGNEEGKNLGNARAVQARAAAHLDSRRKELIRVLSDSLPFMIAGLPTDINDWGIQNTVELIQTNLISNSARNILDKILKNLDPRLAKKEEKRLMAALDDELTKDELGIPDMFQFLSKSDLENVLINHAMMFNDLSGNAEQVIGESVIALSDYRKKTAEMIAESEKLGLAKIAKEYKEISLKIGESRGEIRSKEGEVAKLQALITETENQISAMQSLTEADSKLNKRLELILVIRKIILEYAAKRRDSLSKPLEEGFAEGFKLLSRKSEAVKSVQISTTDYSPFIEMEGYDGNWLDRDLSATEKQHVGLSMLYAISKLSRIPLPIVVDTPVSRMDKDHKEWSVTRFYPKLSHQVIVLTTSDDLGDGLFDELKESDCIASQILLEETGPATAKAIHTGLEEFF
ncbi:MAG: hypothetical protein CMA91_02035, partial [Euryarchaeota archaeon]|nr:hypothetical protein [Euryarchaeota archaeon]